MTAPALGDIPVIDPDAVIERFGDEAVVWSAGRALPTVLDPVATVMLGVIDGAATVAELAADVEEVVGLDRTTAERQVMRAIAAIGAAGALQNKVETRDARRDIFLMPPST